MKTRFLLLAAVAVALAAPHPADAVLKRYRTTGTIEIITPTEGTTYQHQTRTKNCNEPPLGRGIGPNESQKFSCPEATLDIDPDDLAGAVSRDPRAVGSYVRHLLQDVDGELAARMLGLDGRS